MEIRRTYRVRLCLLSGLLALSVVCGAPAEIPVYKPVVVAELPAVPKVSADDQKALKERDRLVGRLLKILAAGRERRAEIKARLQRGEYFLGSCRGWISDEELQAAEILGRMREPVAVDYLFLIAPLDGSPVVRFNNPFPDG